MKIVVDAMGGDHAPKTAVRGAVKAAEEYGTHVILIGKEDMILHELSCLGSHNKDLIEVVHAPDVVEMNESPIAVLRKKKNSSIALGINLLKDGKADAFVSAGNTGAVVAASTLTLGMIQGVDRPGLAIVVPSLTGISLLIDVGANIDPKPEQLLQYGILGSAYSEIILNKKDPSIGLLNIGEEESKGTDFVRQTYQLFEQSDLNFKGNAEGRTVYSGIFDVIVCDGFVGNVVLKVSEGVAETMSTFLKRIFMSSLLAKIGVLLAKSGLRKFKKIMDYSEYGGSPLLGIDGVVIVGHGRSSSNAIKNAIRVAKEEVERGFNPKIKERLLKETHKATP